MEETSDGPNTSTVDAPAGGPPFICPSCALSCATARGFKSHQGSKNCTTRTVRRSQQSVRQRSTIATAPAGASQPETMLSALQSASSVPVMRRLPKAVRYLAAKTLTELLEACSALNTAAAWKRLFAFAPHVFSLPDNKNERTDSLTSILKEQLASFRSNGRTPARTPKEQSSTPKERTLEKRVEVRLNDGDITGAVRLLCSEDVVAKDCAETIAALGLKHPSCDPECEFPEEPDGGVLPNEVTPEEVLAGLKRFKNGSAHGPDCLRAQHLKDMLEGCTEEHQLQLCVALADVLTVIVRGQVNFEVRPFLFGGKLVALCKKEGGIRPIAIGHTIRRLAGKVISQRVQSLVGERLRPRQLGYGTPGGAEAIAHTVRSFVETATEEPKVLLKLDFKNAFNCLKRDELLRAIQRDAPEYYAYFWQSYRHASYLLYREHLIESASGVQQGDPLGPMGFCLGTNPLVSEMESSLVAWYLDDAVVGGSAAEALSDFRKVMDSESRYGLELNFAKCEVFVIGGTAAQKEATLNCFRGISPLVQSPQLANLVVLGSPVTETAVPSVFEEKTAQLNLMSRRLAKVNAHQASFLLRHAIGMPKLMYTLRTSRTWLHPEQLGQWDSTLRESLSRVSNNIMTDTVWCEVTLPIKEGGGGMRTAAGLAVSAYLASVHAAAPLITALWDFDLEETTQAPMKLWQQNDALEVPAEPNRKHQRIWDLPVVKQQRAQADNNASGDFVQKARRLAVSTAESSAWLEPIPSLILGTRLDDACFWTAWGLRFGCVICTEHVCRCGKKVDRHGYHGLACSRSAGRWDRHTNLNESLSRALYSAGCPAKLEPTGTSLVDGRRPDGLTLTPFERGRRLGWDVTCVDTVCLTHIANTSKTAGAAAADAERRKANYYEDLSEQFIVCPFGVETFGSWGPSARQLVANIGRRLRQKTGDPRAAQYFKQRLSLDIQRGNAASVMGTVPQQKSFAEVYFLRTVAEPCSS